MSVTVRTGSVLRRLLGGELEVTGEGNTVKEVFENLGILERVCDNDGKLRRHFNVHVNEEEDVRLLQGLETVVGDGDIITILSAIAGGEGTGKKRG